MCKHKGRYRAAPEPTKNMKAIIIIIFLAITATATEEEYRTFNTPFKQSRSGERVILQLPTSDLGTEGVRFPKDGTYVLNKPEILKKELKSHGYKVLDKNQNFAVMLACLALTLTFIGLFLNLISMKWSAAKST